MATSKVLVLSRTFSTSSVAKAGLIKPPIAVFGIEGRYATALYSAASKEKKVEAVENELNKLKTLLESDKKLANFVYDPLINKNFKKNALQEAFQKQKFSPLTVNLLAVMAENGRLPALKGVVTTFARIMSAYRGEVACEVVTAKPLDAAQKTELEAALKAFLKKGEKLLLQTKVDPSIIGGMIVSIGDKYADMSTATKIKTYTNLIKQAL